MPDVRAEMAHVLFMDLVGYTKLPMPAQRDTQVELQSVVRSSAEFQAAELRNALLRLPTGDGMALVFFDDVEAPLRCALEVARELRNHAALKLRMGIHTGPVFRIADINANLNVAGGAVNVAQRVMDCGDNGHILVSKTVADVLQELGTWEELLHDLGEVDVKHGLRVHIFNVYRSEFGNPELPEKLRAVRKLESGAVVGGRYRLMDRMGGQVVGPLFAAIHINTGIPRAVKIVHENISADPFVNTVWLGRLREIAAAHVPGFVSVYEVDIAETKQAYVVMDLLLGRRLDQEILAVRKLPPRRAIKIMLDLALMLAAFAELDPPFRCDLHPGQIILVPDPQGERAVNVDVTADLRRHWASRTAHEQLILSDVIPHDLHYMPPEMLANRRSPSDAGVYRLGIIGYEMLTGVPTFPPPSECNFAATTAAILTSVPRPLDAAAPTAPSRLADLVNSCLAKDPAARPKPAELVAHLQSMLDTA